MGWLDGLGSIGDWLGGLGGGNSGGIDTSWLNDMADFGSSFNQDSDWLSKIPQFAVEPDAYLGASEPSLWSKVGDIGGKIGGSVLDSVMKDPMRTLGGAFGAGTMLYGMLGDEGKVKAPRMSPAQERMMALAEQSASDAAANKDDEVTAAYKQRVLKALNGEGDVDPRLMREQEAEKADMEARLLRELGPGALTSGKNNQLGAMILNDLNRKQGEARFTNARQILTQDEQSRQGAMNALNQGRYGAANTALGGFKNLSDFAQMGQQSDMFNKAAKAGKYRSAASGGASLLGYSFPRNVSGLYGTTR